MKIYAREIDDGVKDNVQYLERWQNKFGSILSKIKKCKCVNCERKLKDGDRIMYVACHNGTIEIWHTKCKIKYGKT